MKDPGNEILVTGRLLIRPLSPVQLQKYTELNNILETELGLNASGRTISAALKEALEQVIIPHVAASDSYLYSTLWTMIDKDLKLMVGDLCFKGSPNDHGEIEIGYGTYDGFQGKGYMTEAIEAMIGWAFRQPGVRAIVAETERDNVSSHRTLSKNGFVVYKEVENMLWWRLDK
jgi:[ribosomal protein S5]-alanine N-acetyltransferase